MMMSWFYILTFYILTLFMFFNFSNPVLFWVLMEMNLLSFSLVLIYNKLNVTKMDSLNYLLYYFIIQSSASILFLSNFSFGDWGSIFNSDNMFLIAMILKIGLFPLFFWVFSLASSLDFLGLFLLLTFQKIPLFFGLFCCNISIIFFVLMLTFFSGMTLLFFSNNFLDMIISSSISYSFMLYIFFGFSYTFFWSFFLIYSLFLSIALKLMSVSSCFESLSFLVFSFFLGLPPLGLFFFKVMLVEDFYLLFSFTEIILFWGFTVLGLVGYLKIFYHSFFSQTSLYMLKNSVFKTLVFLFSSLGFLILAIY